MSALIGGIVLAFALRGAYLDGCRLARALARAGRKVGAAIERVCGALIASWRTRRRLREQARVRRREGRERLMVEGQREELALLRERLERHPPDASAATSMPRASA